MATRMKFRGRRAERRELAAKNSEEREKRGDAGQLARLESYGHGHGREAERLRKKLNKIGPVTEEPLNESE